MGQLFRARKLSKKVKINGVIGIWAQRIKLLKVTEPGRILPVSAFCACHGSPLMMLPQAAGGLHVSEDTASLVGG